MEVNKVYRVDRHSLLSHRRLPSAAHREGQTPPDIDTHPAGISMASIIFPCGVD